MTSRRTALRGVGLDVVSIARMRRILTGPAGHDFGERVFTAHERRAALERHDVVRYCALAFATKEAVFKAFGTVWQPADDLHDIELVEDDGGPPRVALGGRLLGLAVSRGLWPAVSVTWEGDHAVAVAVLVDSDPEP